MNNDFDPNRGAPDGLTLTIVGVAIAIGGALGVLFALAVLMWFGRDVF